MMKTSNFSKNGRMIGLILLAVMLVSTTLMASDNTIKGSGIVVREARETSSFSAVSVGNAINLVIAQGPEIEVVVQADDNLLPYILTEVTENTLKIGLDPQTSLRDYKEITVEVTAPAFEKINCSGASDVEGTGVLSQASLALHCSGAGSVNLKIDCNSLEIIASGASDVYLEGNTRSLSAEVSGASKMKTSGLECQAAEVDLSGASKIEITVTGQITGKASSASSLNIWGGASVDVSTSGAARVSSR